MTPKDSFRPLRRLLSISMVAGGLLLGLAARADSGQGTFSIATIAGVGLSYSGAIDVKGEGKFVLTGDGTNLVFRTRGADILMRDGRQSYTVGDSSKIGLKSSDSITLTVVKSDLAFPEAGQQSSGRVTGKLSMLGRTSTVTVRYVASEEAGRYSISLAGFEFDYTKHTADGRLACVSFVCARPMVTIATSGAVIEVSR